MTKVWWRLMPLSIAVIFFSALDRTNIAFAAVTMNADLGLSNTAFGFAAGAFAIGYALFGIPAALAVERFGARRTLTVMMVAWGLASAGSALVHSSEQLALARFLVGATEAGSLPGLIYFLSTWFPPAHRGRVFGAAFFIQPIVMVVGAPISTWLLTLDGVFGLAGWRLLFIAEGLPTLLVAGAVFWFLPDKPDEERWLTDAEKNWLKSEQTSGLGVAPGSPERASRWTDIIKPRVIALALVYLCIGTVGGGVIMFLPLMVRSMDVPIAETGLLISAMAVMGGLSLPLWGWWTDKSGNGAGVAAIACLFMATGLGVAALLIPSLWALLFISLTMIGFYGCVVPFWTLPSRLLTGAAAAAGIALVNVCGNMGQFTGPSLVGVITDRTQSYALALGALAGVAVLGAAVVLFASRRPPHARDKAIAPISSH